MGCNSLSQNDCNLNLKFLKKKQNQLNEKKLVY